MQARRALAEVFGPTRSRIAGFLIALVAALLLAWSGQVATVFPEGGLYWNADVWTLLGLAATAILLGVTVPMHWFAWRRSALTAGGQGIGALGLLFSVGSMSCCAPLLLPGLLSLLGFSGTTLLALNLRVHQVRLPLTAVALLFLGLSLWMAINNVSRSCALAGPGSGTR